MRVFQSLINPEEKSIFKGSLRDLKKKTEIFDLKKNFKSPWKLTPVCSHFTRHVILTENQILFLITWSEGNKINFYQEEKSTTKMYTSTSGLETASARGPRPFVASTVPLSYTDTLHGCESLQNWSASRCALSDQSYEMLPNVRSYVQEKYSTLTHRGVTVRFRTRVPYLECLP